MKGTTKSSAVKYTAVIFSIMMLFILACVVYILCFRSVWEEDNRERFSTLSTESSKAFESRFNSLLNSLTDYSREFAGADALSQEERFEILDKVSDNSLYYDLAYIDVDGHAVSALTHSSAILERRNYFRLASAGVKNISEVVTSEFNGEKVNAFVVPVYTKDEITGVLAGAMKSSYLSEFMNSDSLYVNAANYIINTDGVILITPENNLLDADPGMALFDAFNISDSRKVISDIASRNDGGTFTFTVNGVDYLASYNSIDINGWIVLTTARLSDVYSLTFNIFSLVINFTVIFAIAAMACVVFISVRHGIAKKRYADTLNERDILKNTDMLTGSPSFEKFIEDAGDILKKSSDCNFAMISMDANKFRAVNDLLGFDEGNSILIKLADVIKISLGGGETYTHKNADKYYILIQYESDPDIFKRIDTIINDIYYQISSFKLVLAFGIYKVDDIAMDVRSIIDRADLARKTIKNNNESTYAFFDNNMLSKIREEKAIENVMEYALDNHEFKVYLQPKYDLHDHSAIIGAEALVRWFRDGKMIPPGGFIPIFEKNGFILKIDRFVFEEVCKQQKIWLSRGYEMRVISVNMSRVNLQEPNFVRNLYDICTKYNVPTKYFEIEITESVAFDNLEVLTRVFNELKNYGFHISIDDFGTGYSSLNMLKDLPVDVLKIDRAFLTDSNKNERARQIIAHVISLAISLHMKTICEGLETIDQVNLLSDLGCDMAQGFYFARPMPIDDYEKLLYNNANAMV